MKKDFPCKCGHRCEDHEIWLKDPEEPNRMLLGECMYFSSCDCNVFRPDNLKFLEDKRAKLQAEKE